MTTPLFGELFLFSSAYTAAAFGLAGSLIGGAIAGTVSLRVARQAREAAESAWIRDNRRQTYDRFLTSAQQFMLGCRSDTKDTLAQAGIDFWGVYGVIQTVAEIRVVEAARVYAYRLQELEKVCLRQNTDWGDDAESCVTDLARKARHATINAMRDDLELGGDVDPPDDFNPFQSTNLELKYAQRYLAEDGELPAEQSAPPT